MIQKEDRDGLRILRMAHGKVSAMDVELAEALRAELRAAGTDATRAVVITGSGSAFSAGVDLFRVLEGGPAYGERLLDALDGMVRDALSFPKPLVAAINGHAIAGGCILAATCDRRVISEGGARIGLPELTVGVPFTALLFSAVAARLSDGALRDLVYSGRTVQAAEAVAAGFADESCPGEKVLERACEIAAKLAALSPAAFALTKEAIAAPALARAAGLADLDVRMRRTWLEPATSQAIRAYLDKTVGRK